MNSLTKTILLFDLFLSVIVAVDVTCDSVNPMIQSDVACTCKTAPGTDIDWYLDDAFHSSCVLSTICIPQYSGYSYSINTTENVYKMTINSYDYSNCTKITCKDTSNSSIHQSTIPSSLVFDTTFPTSMTEPGSNNTNGIISVTTGCISGFLDVQYDWYIIVDGLEERYSAHGTSIIDTIDSSLCVNCDTDVNGQRTIGFEHSEASGYGSTTGRFKVYLYHVSANWQLTLTLTSRYYYTVKVNKPSESDGPAINKLRNGLIALGVVIVILVIIVIITLTCVPPKFTKIELHDTEIHLEWTDSLNCCQKIFGYSTVYKPKKGQVRDTCCREEITTEKHCTLERLDPMTIYEITLSRTVRCCMPNDQKYHTHSTAIEVKWAKPCCIRKEQILYEVTCNEVKKEITNQTTYTIKDLIPGKMYKVKVFANDNGTNCLMFAEEISTTPIKVRLVDVCYEPGQFCVNCNIKWTVEDFEIPEPSNSQNTLLYNVMCYSGEKQVHNSGYITDSNYTIPELNPDCSYYIHVNVVYRSVTLEPPGTIELATPYKPTNLKHTAMSTEIILEWKKPDYTGNQQCVYKVVCDEGKK